jgi:uncharacterized membrane protein
MIMDLKNIFMYMCLHIYVSLWVSLCTLLYFQDALPPKEMDPAEKHCKQADIVLCLGTR